MKIQKPQLLIFALALLACITGPFGANQVVAQDWFNPLVLTSPYNNSFETTPTGFSQTPSDDFNWTRNSGGTPSGGTGPTGAPFDGGNFYMYAEASFPNNPNKRADLLSPVFDVSGLSNPLVQFRFHMLGADMGQFKMFVRTGNKGFWSEVFTFSGDQGSNWITYGALIQDIIGNRSKVQFRFTAITGNGFRGDMALDLFRIANGPSKSDGSTAMQTDLTEENTLAFSFPNPFQNELSLRLPSQDGEVLLELYDLKGQRLISERRMADGQDIRLDTSEIPAGTYMLKVTGARLEQTLRIVRQ